MGRLAIKLQKDASEVEALAKFEELKCTVINCANDLFLIECSEDAVGEIKGLSYFRIVSPEVKMHKCVTVNLCGMTDKDVDAMSETEVKEKLKLIRDTALWWACQEDDDRCYLDDIKVLKSILPHGKVNFEMPDDLTFIENCIKYKQTRCPKDLKIHEW